ncbi:MAG: helix-turn-helix domain-containing protein [Phycisphaeraceae bacterium]|nr:helix-turn-helix domain-containing protein [Phycisphaeraceae bacterium]
MAKMFYTIEETAEKLKLSTDQVREMATSGKLQQFRDRDKLMFKREQVDNLAGGESDPNDESSIPLASSGDTDAISLTDEKPPRKEDPRQATGVSVFDSSEVEHADPMAQTQVTTPIADQEQLALESVGSGSGLLDLTRESDDTSLGAELLDEIYPGGEGGGAAKGASVPGSSGVFDGAIALESGASGLENLQPNDTAQVAMVNMTPEEEVYDPAGSGMTTGALLVATFILIVGLFLASSAVVDVPSKITAAMAGANVLVYAGIAIVVALVFAAAGFFIGKTQK